MIEIIPAALVLASVALACFSVGYLVGLAERLSRVRNSSDL